VSIFKRIVKGDPYERLEVMDQKMSYMMKLLKVVHDDLKTELYASETD